MGESMEKHHLGVLIDSETVEKRIREVAEQINRDYAGKELHMICILKGSVPFMAQLSKYITVPVTFDYMSCSSYGGGTTSSGAVRMNKDLDEPIEGRHVIIIEDIIDSGNTLWYLQDILARRKPASLKLATLLDKPSRRVHPEVKVDYCCFTIEDKFVVGYGLDYDQHYRNLNYIGYVIFDE
ncbi:MAG: hypoxanthine phosphoribosyltransferase [Lachnospiraceae bacterium]|nr:hypoxanthine phosphoribosyltransferase [Lachnospiraceae bacterium]MBQ6196124.1 hypoxanthine phosphoribosyltransferase [Lachnospiraceae bacterium]